MALARWLWNKILPQTALLLNTSSFYDAYKNAEYNPVTEIGRSWKTFYSGQDCLENQNINCLYKL